MNIDRAARAGRAKQIIEDELFIAAFETVERDAVEDMLKVPWWNVKRLAAHAARIRAIRDARQAIEAVMRDGPDMSARNQRLKAIA